MEWIKMEECRRVRRTTRKCIEVNLRVETLFEKPEIRFSVSESLDKP